MSAAKGLAVVALLCLLYAYGLFRDPAKWEEPRRALISIEMITSGDYVVPRLLGEPYLNKPPLFNWLGAAISGYRIDRVGPPAFRIVSLSALVVVCLLLWRLGISGAWPRPDPLPGLLFATMGIVVQYGRAGEIDMLLCALTTSALACFEFGRRRRSVVLQWIVPQIFVGLGVLTKLVAPLVFYPAVLVTAWRRRRDCPFSPTAFIAGLALMSAIVGAWLFFYSQRQPLGPLVARWGYEAAHRFRNADPGDGLSTVLIHVLVYPFVVVGKTLPWSLWLSVFLWREPRRRLAEALRDPFLYLAAAVSVTVFLGPAFAVEGRGRYLMPALPFVSLGAAWVVRDGRFLDKAQPEAWATRSNRRSLLGRPHAFAWTLGAALLYATIYVATTERARARTGYRYRAQARELAALIDASEPVVVDGAVTYRLVLPLYRRLGEMPRARRPAKSAYEWVGVADSPPPAGAEPLGEAGSFRAWSVPGRPADSP